MSRSRQILCLAVAAVLGGLGWRAFHPASDAHRQGHRASAADAGGLATGEDAVRAAWAGIEGGAGSESTRHALDRVRAILSAMPRERARAWIEDYLASGEDRATGLGLEIGTGGELSAWPSIRVFLLDQLLAIDPGAAERISRSILREHGDPDEWAVALRNIGRVGEGEEVDAFLRERTESMIRHPAWQADPSVGYLNAFDVLVHTHSVSSTPLLSELVQRKDRRDLAHAAFLTLDRLVQREPVAQLQRLAADRALHQSRPEMVAQQFARADLRDPAQRALVGSWLRDPVRRDVELRAFAGVYPNGARFVSRNLLTVDRFPDGAELAAHDREALRWIDGWLADPSFEQVRWCLEAMRSRVLAVSPPGR